MIIFQDFAIQHYGIIDVDELDRGDFDLVYSDWRISTDLAIEEMYGDKPKVDWITEGF